MAYRDCRSNFMRRDEFLVTVSSVAHIGFVHRKYHRKSRVSILDVFQKLLTKNTVITYFLAHSAFSRYQKIVKTPKMNDTCFGTCKILNPYKILEF